MEASKRQRGGRPKMCKRTKDQREFDLAFCSNLFLRGYTYREISERLNEENARRGVGYTITKQMVYWDMQQLLIEWKRERMVVICFQISIFEPLETTEYMLQTNYQLVTHIFRN